MAHQLERVSSPVFYAKATDIQRTPEGFFLIDPAKISPNTTLHINATSHIALVSMRSPSPISHLTHEEKYVFYFSDDDRFEGTRAELKAEIERRRSEGIEKIRLERKEQRDENRRAFEEKYGINSNPILAESGSVLPVPDDSKIPEIAQEVRSIKTAEHDKASDAKPVSTETQKPLTTKQRDKQRKEQRQAAQTAARVKREEERKKAAELKNQTEQKLAEEQARVETAKAAELKRQEELKQQQAQKIVETVKSEKPPKPELKSDVVPHKEIKSSQPTEPLVVESAPAPKLKVVAEAASSSTVQPEYLTLKEIGPLAFNAYAAVPESVVQLCVEMKPPHESVQQLLRSAPNDITSSWSSGQGGSPDRLWHFAGSAKNDKRLRFFKAVMSHVDVNPKSSLRYVGGWSNRVAIEFPQAGVQGAPEGPGILMRGDGAIFIGRFDAALVFINGGYQVIPTLEQGKILTPEGYLIKINNPVRYDTLRMPARQAMGGDQFPSSMEIYTPKTREAYSNFIKAHCEVAEGQFDLSKKRCRQYLESLAVSDKDWQLCYEGFLGEYTGFLAPHSDQKKNKVPILSVLRLGYYEIEAPLFLGTIFSVEPKKLYRIDPADEDKKTLVYEGDFWGEPNQINSGLPKMGRFYASGKEYVGLFNKKPDGTTSFQGTMKDPVSGQVTTVNVADFAQLEPTYADIPPIVLKIAI